MDELKKIEALLTRDIETAKRGIRHFQDQNRWSMVEVTAGEKRAYENALGYVTDAIKRLESES